MHAVLWVLTSRLGHTVHARQCAPGSSAQSHPQELRTTDITQALPGLLLQGSTIHMTKNRLQFAAHDSVECLQQESRQSTQDRMQHSLTLSKALQHPATLHRPLAGTYASDWFMHYHITHARAARRAWLPGAHPSHARTGMSRSIQHVAATAGSCHWPGSPLTHTQLKRPALQP